MAQYEEQNELDYRTGGDTIDDFAQKYMKEINRIYQFLNNIREHNSTGTYQVEPQPYIFKVTDNKLYIRNGANNAWLYLFEITYRMGMSDNPDAVILTSDDVTSTAEALKLVKTNSDGDIEANITGNATYFGNRLAADYITVDDVSDSGAASKIVKTDSNGVAQISISGSAVQLNGKAASYYLNQNDVTTSGEANKIVKTDDNGKIAADITGNAAKFGNKTADNYLTTDDVATVEAGTVTSTPNKLVKTNANGLLPVNISGNAGQIAGRNAEINNLQDGQVLTYRLASNTWRNEDKGVVGSGRALALYDGSTLLAKYDGDAPISIDLAKHNRIASTAYTVGTFVNHDTLPAGWFLECTTAGTSSSSALTITSPTIGGTVTDGTVVWTIRKSASTQDLTSYLPLSGGSMTGSTIKRSVDASGLILAGATSQNKGASVQLNGKERNDGYAGWFYVEANDGTNAVDLVGRPNGTLLWNNNVVLTEATGLSLSGGAMTGSQITRNRDDSNLNLYGGTTWDKGSLLTLWGADSIGNGRIDLVVRNSQDYCSFNAYANGTLTWDGDDLGGSAIVAKSIGVNGYVKRADGEIMQWGEADPITPGVAKEVTFPISFSGVPRVFVTPYTTSGQSSYPILYIADMSATGFKIYASEAVAGWVNWFAVGAN